MPEKRGKLRYQWSKLRAGDIVEFSYKGQRKNARRRYRTVLILTEKLMVQRQDGKKVRLVHGLQLKSVPRKRASRILKEAQYAKLLSRLGDVEVRTYSDEPGGEGYAIAGSRQTAVKRYERVDALIAEYGIYRTFDFAICKRSALFLSEFQWPSKVTTKIQRDLKDKIVQAGARDIKKYFEKQNAKPVGFKPIKI